jgi:hypothetical protein
LNLLAKLAARVLADRERAVDLAETALETGWLGTAGATGEELAALEARLGLTLPPSYRSFLETTNGWGPEWVEIWAGNEEGPALRTALQISTVADGVCLLIPSDKTEWETWFFANWIPGADRHSTFRAFMENELQRP